LLGREAIERNHVDVFGRGQKGTTMAVKAIRVRPLGTDAGSVLTVGGIGKETPIVYDKFQTFTLVRANGGWLCASFQNTAMSQSAKTFYNEAATLAQNC
jgi:hypothetical protein